MKKSLECLLYLGYKFLEMSNDGGRLLGENFGSLQTTETDYRTSKQIKRNKLKSVANKAIQKGNTAKADRINRHNLGKKKWDKRESRLVVIR